MGVQYPRCAAAPLLQLKSVTVLVFVVLLTPIFTASAFQVPSGGRAIEIIRKQQRSSHQGSTCRLKMQSMQRRAYLVRAGILARAAFEARDGVLASGVPARLESSRVDASLGSTDLIHPASLLGAWQCQRKIASVEGNAGEALLMWRELGGGGGDDVFSGRLPESFQIRFIKPPPGIQCSYLFEGKSVDGVILDRGFEFVERNGRATVMWDARTPGMIKRTVGGNASELNVLQRNVELPNEKGWGGSEIIRVSTASGSKAARVQRRFRRAFDGGGNRVVEGLEIVKTFRSVEALNENPTSITKTQIRMTRSPLREDAQEVEEAEEAEEVEEAEE